MYYPVDLFVIRHAQSVANEHMFGLGHDPDAPLSAIGRLHARAIRIHFNGVLTGRKVLMMTSDTLRTQATARGIYGVRAIRSALNERIWTDRVAASIRALLKERDQLRKHDMLHFAFEGGETLIDVGMRAGTILCDPLMGNYRDAVILCTHHEVVCMLRARIEKIGSEEFSAWYRANHPKNGEIVHYTRRNPVDGHINEGRPRWFRSIHIEPTPTWPYASYSAWEQVTS